MVKDCKVSLTLGRMGGFHFLASGKSVKKITSGWEWRQLTGRKLQKKMKGESGAAPAALPEYHQCDARWPNFCYYLSNSFTQLNKEHPDLRWEYAPAALRKQAGKSLERQENGNHEVWSQHKPHAGLRAHSAPSVPAPRAQRADSLHLWPHSPLCTQGVYLLWTNLERKHFKKHLVCSQQSPPAPGCSIPQYF